MAIDDLVGSAPRPIRSAVWVLAVAVSLAGIGALGFSAIEGRAQMAASAATSPLLERVARLESGQQNLWSVTNTKLDSISQQITQTQKDVAVLAQRVDDRK